MIAFIKKEIMENARTKKILIMLIVFLVLAIMSPLFAKLTPEILKMMDIDASALNLANPTAFDSFVQFFKNIGQMGLIILVIIFSGIMSNEFSKGTLINILTKGVKRNHIILSKFLVASIIWILVYFVSFLIFYLYTIYYFDTAFLNNIIFSASLLCLFGILLISIIILGGTLFRNTIGSLLTPMISYGILLILSVINKLESFNPISLTILNNSLIENKISPSYLYPAIIITICLIVTNIIISILVFKKSEI